MCSEMIAIKKKKRKKLREGGDKGRGKKAQKGFIG